MKDIKGVDNTVLDQVVENIMDLFFEGRPSYVVTLEKMKKTPVEGGWLYCFYDEERRDWSPDWQFVPKVNC